MTKKVVVLQEDKNDCAAACVSSLIKYYNGFLDMETIRNIINTTKHGTNAYDLINGCKEIGFDGFGKKLSFEELVSYYKFPLIAHIKKDNYYHFVVIYDINKSKEKITVMDPSIGLRKISFKEFVISYQGVIISLVKVKELPKEIETNHLFKVMMSSVFKNKKILIIDNYIDDSVLKMLTKKNNNVEVVILTSDKSNIQQIDIQKFNKEYPILKVAKTNKFHDRFIIIDNEEMYHLGASIKDLGKKCFGINKIEDVEIMEKILNHK